MARQQVNSQSQSGTAQFYYGNGSYSGNGSYPVNATNEIEKEVEVKIKAFKGGNAQGQGQITQADYINQNAYIGANGPGVAS